MNNILFEMTEEIVSNEIIEKGRYTGTIQIEKAIEILEKLETKLLEACEEEKRVLRNYKILTRNHNDYY